MITPRTDNRIYRYAKAYPFAIASEISSKVFPTDVAPSAMTVRRRLCKRFHLKNHVPEKKPRLSQKNIRDRIAFYLKYKDWSKTDWKDVMLSKESLIEYLVVVLQTSALPTIQLPTCASDCKKLPKNHDLGATTVIKRCSLWFMPPNTIINGYVYLEIVQEKLESITNTHKFQHNRAPCHRIKLVSKVWFHENGIEVVSPWSGNSPNLNLIENCSNISKIHLMMICTKKKARMNSTYYSRIFEEDFICAPFR